MIKLAANLSFLFTEHDFRGRFSAAAEAGFTAVEYLFPYEYEKRTLAGLLTDNNLKQALFNLSPGDWDQGERGLAAILGRTKDFQISVEQAVEYAEALGCQRLHIMSGLRDAGISYQAQRDLYLANLEYAAEQVKGSNITFTIEPINTIDMPGYFLNDFDEAANIVAEIASPHLKLQFDFYHCHRIYGEVLPRLKQYLPITSHIQLASPPGRNEPSVGELDHVPLLSYLESTSYDGYVGCEYKPSYTTRSSLKWAEKYLKTG